MDHLLEKQQIDVDVIKKANKRPQTSFSETLVHFYKSNIGAACFALGEAFRNAGLLLGSTLIAVVGLLCVYQQHVLIKCSAILKEELALDEHPDYAQTLELSFSLNKKWKKYSQLMKKICNLFLIITQLGFCSVYFLFIANNLNSILQSYGFNFELKHLMGISLIPIISTSILPNLKYLAPFSGVGTFLMFLSIAITFYYAVTDLPDIAERKLVNISTQLPLFIGMSIYLFEGIGMVLPLKNEMKEPKDFSKRYGVLNIGTISLIIMFIAFGFVGYWRFGDNVKSSLSLNLPADEWLVQSILIMIPISIALGYALQLYIPIEIMFPALMRSSKVIAENSKICEIIFRIFMVFVTLSVALLVPNLGLLISMIGAVCSTTLALIFPVVINYFVITKDNDAMSACEKFKSLSVLLLALISFLSGGYESISRIIDIYQQ